MLKNQTTLVALNAFDMPFIAYFNLLCVYILCVFDSVMTSDSVTLKVTTVISLPLQTDARLTRLMRMTHNPVFRTSQHFPSAHTGPKFSPILFNIVLSQTQYF